MKLMSCNTGGLIQVDRRSISRMIANRQLGLCLQKSVLSRASATHLFPPILRSIQLGNEATYYSLTVAKPCATSRWGFPPQAEYKYSPLSSEHFIRLLRFTRPKVADYGSITCSLTSIHRDQVPPYMALSYTWGNPEANQSNDTKLPARSRQILIDSHTHSVTENLYEALLRLRHRQEVQQSNTFFWIDAICINQLDIPEKSAQVNIMSNIFTGAETVFVWLGPDRRGDGPRVLELISELNEVVYDSAKAKERNWQLPQSWNSYGMSKVLETLGLSPWSDDDWLSLGLFLTKSWYRRVWCAQEAILARDFFNVVALYGDTEFQWVDLYKLSKTLIWTGMDLSLGNFLPLLQRPGVELPKGRIGIGPAGLMMSRLLISSDVRDTDIGQTLGIPGMKHITGQDYGTLNAGGVLLELLAMLPNREATDKRDNVFALLGLVNAFCSSHGIRPSTIKADYSKTVSQVLIETTRYIIEATKSLNFLCLTRAATRRMPDSPSWTNGFSWFGWDPLLSQPLYNAYSSRAKSSDIRFQNGGDGLIVRGFEIAAIKDCSEEGHEINIDCKFVELFQMVLGLPRIGHNGQPRVEMLWRTLVGDIGHRSSGMGSAPVSASADVGDQFAIWLQYLFVRRKLLDNKYGSENSSYEELLQLLDEISESDDTGLVCRADTIRDLLVQCGVGSLSFTESEKLALKALPWNGNFDNVTQMLPHRRLFTTTKCELGMGPDGLQPGDSVWILSGCRIPLAFRRVPHADTDAGPECYELLGETYLHGYMKGEAIDLLGPNPNWKDISIV